MKNILIPVDGSANSLEAIHLIDSLGLLENHKFYLLNVKRITMQFGENFPVSSEREMIEYLTQKGKENLKSAETLFQGKNYEAIVKLGEPVSEILSFADEIKADLIVMSSHGRSGLKALLMGSVSSKVLAYSKNPVIIARNWQEVRGLKEFK